MWVGRSPPQKKIQSLWEYLYLDFYWNTKEYIKFPGDLLQASGVMNSIKHWAQLILIYFKENLLNGHLWIYQPIDINMSFSYKITYFKYMLAFD